jgi:hypothetical protein
MKHETRWMPGPWEVQDHPDKYEPMGYLTVVDANGRDICGTENASAGEQTEEYDEGFHRWRETGLVDTMQLIAAAPDLYEALENIENDDGRIPMEIWNMRNLALAKARGMEQ